MIAEIMILIEEFFYEDLKEQIDEEKALEYFECTGTFPHDLQCTKEEDLDLH